MRGTRKRELTAEWLKRLKTPPTEAMMKQVKRAYNRQGKRDASISFNERKEKSRLRRQKARNRKKEQENETNT